MIVDMAILIIEYVILIVDMAILIIEFVILIVEMAILIIELVILVIDLEKKSSVESLYEIRIFADTSRSPCERKTGPFLHLDLG